jgi:hypothetical protein
MTKKLTDFTRPYAMSKNQHARRLAQYSLPRLDPAKQAELENTKLKYRMSLAESVGGFDQWARKEDATDLKDRARHEVHMRTPAKRTKIGIDQYEEYLASKQLVNEKDPVAKRRLVNELNTNRRIGDQYIEVSPDPERIALADRIFSITAWDTSYPASVWRATEKLVKASREADHETFDREAAYVQEYMTIQASKAFVAGMSAEQSAAAQRQSLESVFGKQQPPAAPAEQTPSPMQWEVSGAPAEATNGV